jgi:hypothetical protein
MRSSPFQDRSALQREQAPSPQDASVLLSEQHYAISGSSLARKHWLVQVPDLILVHARVRARSASRGSGCRV